MYNILRKASNNPVAIFIPIFQMRMLRVKEVKCFALDHTAKKEEDWKLNLVSVKDQHTPLPHCSFPTVYQPHVYHLPYFSRIYSASFSQFNIPEVRMHFINDSLLSDLKCGHGFSKNIKSTIPILCHSLPLTKS